MMLKARLGYQENMSPFLKTYDLVLLFLSMFLALTMMYNTYTSLSYMFCLVIICMPACSVASVVSTSLRFYGLQPTRLLCPWDSPGKNTGMGCCALLQRIFPTQGLNSISCVSCIAGEFFTTEPPGKPQLCAYLFTSAEGQIFCLFVFPIVLSIVPHQSLASFCQMHGRL